MQVDEFYGLTVFGPEDCSKSDIYWIAKGTGWRIHIDSNTSGITTECKLRYRPIIVFDQDKDNWNEFLEKRSYLIIHDEKYNWCSSRYILEEWVSLEEDSAPVVKDSIKGFWSEFENTRYILPVSCAIHI